MNRRDSIESEAERNGTYDLGPLTPFMIFERADGSLAVAARAADGVLSIAPLRLLPDPPRRRLIECPHCDRPFIFSEWADGRETFTPLPKASDDDGEDGIPFG